MSGADRWPRPYRSIIIIGSSWIICYRLSYISQEKRIYRNSFSCSINISNYSIGLWYGKEGKTSQADDTASVFRGVSGGRTNGKQGKCGHTCYFCVPRGRKNACWGASPNPALRDKMSRSKLAASPSLPLLFLILAPVRHA